MYKIKHLALQGANTISTPFSVPCFSQDAAGLSPESVCIMHEVRHIILGKKHFTT